MDRVERDGVSIPIFNMAPQHMKSREMGSLSQFLIWHPNTLPHNKSQQITTTLPLPALSFLSFRLPDWFRATSRQSHLNNMFGCEYGCVRFPFMRVTISLPGCKNVRSPLFISFSWCRPIWHLLADRSVSSFVALRKTPRSHGALPPKCLPRTLHAPMRPT